MNRPIIGPIAYRPAPRLYPVGSHRPPVTIEQRDAVVAPMAVPMWLRELRRDRREFII